LSLCADHAELARCKIQTFRYRVVHVAARITCQNRLGQPIQGGTKNSSLTASS
jgi:hypothetical protein